MDNIKNKKLILSMFLSFLSFQALGFTSDINIYLSKKEEEVEKLFESEVVQQLYDYRREVEKSAYEITLKLCEGYRRASEMGPHPAHGRYLFKKSESMKAWLKVMYEGAAVPFSRMGGLKGFAVGRQHLAIYDLDNYFKSLYTTYLINSTGFLAGALHCLEMDEEEFLAGRSVTQFAATILQIDVVMSGVSYVGLELAMAWPIEKVFSLIASKTKFLWNPMTKLLSSMSFRSKRVQAVVAGTGLAAAGGFVMLMNEKEQEEEILGEAAFEALDITSESNKRSKRMRRRIHLSRAYHITKGLYKEEMKLGVKLSPGEYFEMYADLFNYMDEFITEEVIEQMNNDLLEIEREFERNIYVCKKKESDEESVKKEDEACREVQKIKLYFKRLKIFLPMIIELNEKKKLWEEQQSEAVENSQASLT